MFWMRVQEAATVYLGQKLFNAWRVTADTMMDLRNRTDLISGISVAAFGLYVTVNSARLDYVSEYGPGPGFLPFWLGIGLLALAVYLALGNLLRPVQEPRQAESWTGVGRVLSGWSALMIAIFLLPWIGFSLTLALLTAFLILALERRSKWTGIGVGFGLAIGFYLIFVFALGLSLPVSRLGF
jgi:putative tricarboxylic transport membrane protein